jgi:outer membrane lipoprotein-sorting protein
MNNENIEEILKSIGVEDIPADVRKIAQETSNNFSSSLKQTKQPKRHILLEQIMKSRMTKLAAAAVIIIAILAGLPFLNNGGSSITLAGVLEKIEQTRAYMYKKSVTITGNMMPFAQEETITAIVSVDFGMKRDTETTDPNTGKITTLQTYVLPEQKMFVTIMPEKKQYMRMDLDDDILAKMKQQNNDPREIIKQIMKCEYTELGRSVIDGVEVQGFRTTDPAFLSTLDGDTTSIELTLWVDAENWLPFRSEMEIKSGEQRQISVATYDYRWDVPVQADDFEPVIPEDFKPFPGSGMKMPGMSEADAIEGLSRFAEMAGRYPKTLNMLELEQEIAALALNKDNQYLKVLTEKMTEEMKEMSRTTEMSKDEIRDAIMRKSMEYILPLQSIGLFYRALVEDKKEPIYYGESVGPDDADKVLLKWKVSDDQYRIIFGDLSAGNFSPEELAVLEKTL